VFEKEENVQMEEVNDNHKLENLIKVHVRGEVGDWHQIEID